MRRSNKGVPHRKPVLQRILEKLDKNGPVPAHAPELGPCWIWQGAKFNHGYGQIVIMHKYELVHRVSFKEHGNELSDDEDLLHRCDTKLCARPSHMTAGTHLDNMADMRSKKRQAVGTRVPTARLNDEKVKELRGLWKTNKHSAVALAARFDISERAARDAINYKSWKHVP
jgi:hypothetical protein